MLKLVKLPLAITYLLAIALGAMYWGWGGRADANAPLSFFLFTTLYMWVPGFVAIAFAKREGLSLPFFHQFNRYYWIAPLSAIALSFLALYISTFLGTWNEGLEGNYYGVIQYVGLAILLGLTLNAFMSLGEELLWRGYLHAKLKVFGPIKASLAIGLMWGIWNAPLILMKYNYPRYPFLGVLMAILVAVSASPFLFYLRERGGAIFIPSLFRGIVSVFSGLTFMFFIDPNYFVLGMTGIIGVFFFALLSIWGLFTLKKTAPHGF